MSEANTEGARTVFGLAHRREQRKMRLVSIFWPWATIRRITMLLRQPPLEDWQGDEYNQGWKAGYERAMYEVGLNVGIDLDHFPSPR